MPEHILVARCVRGEQASMVDVVALCNVRRASDASFVRCEV